MVTHTKKGGDFSPPFIKIVLAILFYGAPLSYGEITQQANTVRPYEFLLEVAVVQTLFQ